MKIEKKREARALREKGESVNKIATILRVSKGTVSIWVRDVKLTEEQLLVLRHRNAFIESYYHRGKSSSETARTKRVGYQDVGRTIIRNEPNSLFSMGCMLYWGEGSKSRYMMCFSNSDPMMVRFFMKFLRTACSVADERITIRVHGFLGNGIEREDIIQYWMELTQLPASQLRSCSFDKHSPMSSRRKKNLIYGTVHLTVCSVELVQRIYGGISEIAESSEPMFIS